MYIRWNSVEDVREHGQREEEMGDSAEGLTFEEFLSRPGIDADAVNHKSREPAIWKHAGEVEEGGDEIYVWREGSRREATYLFPNNTDRLRAYMYARYDHNGGEEDYS